MDIVKTGIDGLIEIKPKIHQDNRGWFQEVYKHSAFKDHCQGIQFIQDNLSFSKKGVLRGLHLQSGASGQAKLVTVLSGKVLDVVVDLRKASPTFGQSFQLELDSLSRNMLYVPAGFAHGFSALEDSLFMYKCSNEYDPSNETGIVWNDPDLNINWRVDNPTVSEKDKVLPTFQELLRKSVISPF